MSADYSPTDPPGGPPQPPPPGPPTLPLRRSWPVRHKAVTALLSAAALAIIIIVIVTVTASGPGTSMVTGTLDNGNEWTMDNTGSSNAWVDVETATGAQTSKCLDSETIDILATIGGRSVTVASGQASDHGTALLSDCISTFTIKNVPGGYAAYGVQVRGAPGTVNYTAAQLAKGIGLDIGGASG